MAAKERKTILVDQDNVIAGFDQGLDTIWHANYSGRPQIDRRGSFYYTECCPVEFRMELEEIFNSRGFFESLPVMAGAAEALEEMRNLGHLVIICTSPLLSNPYCASEKILWIEKNLGRDWSKQLVITNDKTLIRGELLVDDKPESKGAMEPTWEHILYNWPYNEQIKSKRRLTWDNWREVLWELVGTGN